MTRIKPGLTSSALLLAFVSFFSVSQAASAAPCTALVEELKTALLDDICTFSQCRGLSHKLDSVNRKLEQDKFRHAGRKLADFGAVVEDLVLRNKPEISMDAYQAMIDPYFNNAEICIANGGVIPEIPGADDPGTYPVEGPLF